VPNNEAALFVAAVLNEDVRQYFLSLIDAPQLYLVYNSNPDPLPCFLIFG